MERCAVFVDAGWFLSELAQAITGKGGRWSVQCDYPRLAAALGQLAQQVTQLPLLRIYWYDAAPDGIPTSEHLEIARLRDVKLRLGRISYNQQKGVDALLILDLTTLARERAIASAMVLSGDEDIREGIASAQSLGVRVTIAGVGMVEGRPSLATTLVQEADDQQLLDMGFLGRYVRAASSEPRWAAPAPANSSTAEAMGSAPDTEMAGAIRANDSGDGSRPPRAVSPREFGQRFGASYADRLSDADLRVLQREAPEVPADAAAQLFREAEQVFGETRGRPDLRRELRMGFWDHVMQRRNA